MKLSGGVEWAVHCCIVLTGLSTPASAAKLAEFHDVSSTYLAKQMQALARAGLIRSVQGYQGGYVLTRAPDEISVLDVVLAVEGEQPMFVCTEIRQRGPFASSPDHCTTACAVAKTMLEAEQAWRSSLKAVTIAELAGGAGVLEPSDSSNAVRTWFQGASTTR